MKRKVTYEKNPTFLKNTTVSIRKHHAWPQHKKSHNKDLIKQIRQLAHALIVLFDVNGHNS